MASRTEEGGVFEANFPDNKLTLYLAQDGARVLRVTFHETSSWCHEITWICTLFPDKYSPYFNSEFPKQLSALREQFATHGRLTSIQIDRWMFVFGYNTGDTVRDLLRGYTSIEKIILKFLHDIDAHVTDITMKSQVKTVDAAAVRRDKGPETVPGGTTDHDIPCKDKHDVHEDTSPSHPKKKEGSETYIGMTDKSRAKDSFVTGQANIGNTNINISLYLRESSGKADYQTNWETTNDIPQWPSIDFESLATQLEQIVNAILILVRKGCTVFCFEHESKEDATNMIIRHAEVKEVILHFLQELDPSIQDIRMKVEFRELCQPEEQTADTSETQPRGMTDPEHKGEEGTSRSHPQQKDETSHLHIQETGDDSSSLSHSPQEKKKYEDTCLPHPQETEDKTSLQQTDEDTSHLQPQEVYVKDKFKYQPIKIEKDGALQVRFKKYKLTLYLTKKGRRVLGVTFHDTTSWSHVITWTCILIPDEYSPYINVKFLQQLPALKKKFATHGRLTRIQIDRRMFVFRHETEAKATEMLGSYTLIEEIILKFLRETGAQVTDIKMKSASIDQETLPRGTTDQDVLFSSKHGDDVDAPHSHPQQRQDDIPHAQKDEDAAHLSTGSYTYTGASGNSKTEKSILGGEINTNAIYQDNRTVNNTIIINPPSGKAVCESCWKAIHKNIPQWTDIDNETVKILLKEVFLSALKSVWWGCMVFCFEHESMEDAIGMIAKHAVVKEDILHFLQELEPSIDDIVMEVEVRELSESEEQTAETSGSGSQASGYSSGSQAGGYSSGSQAGGYSSGSQAGGYSSGSQAGGYTSGSQAGGYSSGSQAGGYSSGSHSSEYTSSDPSLRPLVKGQDSDRRASSDPSRLSWFQLLSTVSHASSDPSLRPLVKGQDSDRRASSDPSRLSWFQLLSTASHASSDPSRRSWFPLLSTASHASSDPSQDHSRRRRDPWLSTASHATPSPADCDLHLAIWAGNLENVKWCLTTPGVDVNSRGEESMTPVMEAAVGGNREVVKLLVRRGADMSLVDRDGNNILHWACAGGDVETVEFVLSLNVVDIDARNESGETAADVARDWGHPRVADFLKSRGAQ